MSTEQLPTYKELDIQLYALLLLKPAIHDLLRC